VYRRCTALDVVDPRDDDRRMPGSSLRSFDGTSIWCDDSGGSGPAVLLVHGAAVSSRTNFANHWVPGEGGGLCTGDGPTIAGALLDAGARVVGVDLRGHGRSGRSEDPNRYRDDAFARDVVAVADGLCLDRFDAVGYSMGAAVLMRLLDREPRLRSVALCGTGPYMTTGDEAWSIDAVGDWFVTDTWDDERARMFRAYAEVDVHDVASIGAALTGMSQAPRERLAMTSCAVLVLNGGDDDGNDDAARLAALIPGARALVVGHGDHASAVHDGAYIGELVAFLAERW
jgi:pimeloyl-ACP methyl ester carboxylesterase